LKESIPIETLVPGIARPLAVDATRIRELVENGILRDRLKAVVRRFDSGPVNDPQWLMESAYGYGQVPRFSLSVYREDVPGVNAQARVLSCARILLSPECEWIIDDERMAEVDAVTEDARTTAAALAHEWMPGERFWSIGSAGFGLSVRFLATGKGPKEARTMPPIPQAVLDHAFAGVPHVAHLVRETGNRMTNLRFGTSRDEEIVHEDQDAVTMLRILSGAPAEARPHGR
jgi:hypothetical protein